MLIGVIGPQSSIDILTLNKSSLPIEFLPLPYKEFTEAAAFVKKYEASCDALLFTGQTPYAYACSKLHPTKPWEYLPRNVLSTMCALVKAGLIYGNIHNVSTDGFSNDVLETILTELNDVSIKLNFYNVNIDIMAPDYIQQVIDYHTQKYEQGKVDLCLTGVQSIYERLKSQKIPTIKTNPNFSSLQRKLELLMLKHQVIHSGKSLPAVVAIHPFFRVDYSTHKQSEIQLLHVKTNISESIYYYAQKLNAAVFLSDNTYYLASNADSLNIETSHFTSINDLLYHNPAKPLLEKLAIGIGIGTTSLLAKFAADKALKRAGENTDSCCFVMDDNNHLFGPLTITPTNTVPTDTNTGLTGISQETGISLANLSKIDQVLRQYKIKSITSAEMAFYCNMPLRKMNRLLQKLEWHGYITIVGKDAQPASGRPRRILQFNLYGNL